jgi:hypothetical protein
VGAARSPPNTTQVVVQLDHKLNCVTSSHS